MMEWFFGSPSQSRIAYGDREAAALSAVLDLVGEPEIKLRHAINAGISLLSKGLEHGTAPPPPRRQEASRSPSPALRVRMRPALLHPHP